MFVPWLIALWGYYATNLTCKHQQTLQVNVYIWCDYSESHINVFMHGQERYLNFFLSRAFKKKS